MTLRQALGGDVQRIFAQVDALLDREDGILALFDGGRVVSYGHGFGVSASQLELLGVELERALRAAVGQRTKIRNRRGSDEGTPRSRPRSGIDGCRRTGPDDVFQLARKIA
jgi:hypothetical protein